MNNFREPSGKLMKIIESQPKIYRVKQLFFFLENENKDRATKLQNKVGSNPFPFLISHIQTEKSLSLLSLSIYIWII